ncbi:MAG: sterol desaturase family protein [Chloroflexi bacterium]|nr:sterol desaturase family protein [Chloroflexota bacterium]
MSHLPIDHSDIPLRLFKSDFLEFFSHISPITITVIWLPVAVFCLVRSIVQASVISFPIYIPVAFLIGLVIWTLSEYVLHRFVFHFPTKTERAERFVFLFHGVHHAQPQCKTRLVMPPVVSIPLAALFYGLFYLVVVVLLKMPHWLDPLFSAFIFGYLIYDITHYATHHFPMRSGYAKYIKRYHMQHHYKTPDKRFGVSSPIWDMVFKTQSE